MSKKTSVYRVLQDSGSHPKNRLKSYKWDKCILDIQLFYYRKYGTSRLNEFHEMVFHTRKRMLLNYGWIAREQMLWLLLTNPKYYYFIIASKIKRKSEKVDVDG